MGLFPNGLATQKLQCVDARLNGLRQPVSQIGGVLWRVQVGAVYGALHGG
ncbi:MAG: hypothetical protein IPH35_10035 [Rhodoferax sp.]|nr:hypothetical protein [Rhodoferax sp.]